MAYAEIVCTICNDRFKQEKRFIDHMQKAHDLIADETCYLNVNNIDPRKCKCGCGANVQWKGWKEGYTSDYVRGHNALEHNVFKEKAAELLLPAACEMLGLSKHCLSSSRHKS